MLLEVYENLRMDREKEESESESESEPPGGDIGKPTMDGGVMARANDTDKREDSAVFYV